MKGDPEQMKRIESAVKEFIEKDIFNGVPQDIAPDQSLLQSGIIDSMTLFRLMFFLQERFGVTVPDEHLMAENFETLATIAAYVAGERGRVK